MITKIYFDTEFEGLFLDAKIISIGLVNALGNRKFYAEITNNYDVNKCSEFCKKMVIPLLEEGNYSMDLDTVRFKLHEWLTQENGVKVLVCDSKRDIIQLECLFPNGLPQNCSYEVLSFWKNLKRRIKNVGRRIHKKNRLRVHHAMDDALVNRIIFENN
ncbi:hypothetical protein GW796_08615 [archaeon]|nr:hypothetical protein [archaeon]NCQ51941.1 hypothetical protein [archaeon]